MEREMKIRGLMIDPAANTPIVVLKEVNGDQLLPIWVGPFEANAIAFEIEKMSPPRPMTHDLLRNLILQMDGRVRRVVVTELRNNTFYAVIELEVAGKMLFLDARPSDAIALALRVDAPIFVHESVLENSTSVIVERQDEEPSEKGDDLEFDWPDEIDESDIGRG
ncbi:bifunctional nuclease family protein [Chloracidobacterium aggregatum]|jgi:bifunctional DNase/RNase|uniref:Bifunctional nuclease family protein n=1 Tax=Chloracidobacterium sp. N TaxID=2821540 RepID=A0ABX8AWA8_9BACT|nr:bifunctional nuclease family protein [Chloracidobacterium aggregatum]QUV84660.1 bifunctional nuclease family protein [Chloracidobacterium sp. 2]QUV86838.1 bifunctional nuclease family protein [Chloracidobacterium sp. S]QUV91834.1 bifunctional nuclease family protein [Chloracidobacterium sp. A]QUV92968.1 bifunctional nuclease family protein [Chloracidobacterium sp. N]QUV96122.1 bifunctional nuclease family protein [Chloracidobacterium sp. E]